MAKKVSDSIADFCSDLGATLKSAFKLAVQSRRCNVSRAPEGERLIIMGNGPSLATNIREDLATLKSSRTLAVNFAANADEFIELRPDYYLLADPHFFTATESDANLAKMYRKFNEEVDWDMTLFVPARIAASAIPVKNPHIHIQKFNPVGVEGFKWFERMAYSSGRGMPRPRNVLIPAIMLGMQMGYRDIYIIGADHSWLKTLDVNERNEVVSVQPHFYKDNDEEKQRVTSVYKNVRLHEILLSFHVAFKAYHKIAAYASTKGINIYNSTPASYIDAFPRRQLTIFPIEN